MILCYIGWEWDKNAKNPHSKPENLGVVKLNKHMWTGSKEVSKKFWTAATPRGWYNLWSNLNCQAQHPVLWKYLKLSIWALFDLLNLFASRTQMVHRVDLAVPWNFQKAFKNWPVNPNDPHTPLHSFVRPFRGISILIVSGMRGRTHTRQVCLFRAAGSFSTIPPLPAGPWSH